MSPMTQTTTITRRTLFGTAGAMGVSGLASGCARGSLTRAAPGPDVTMSSDNPSWNPGFLGAGDVLRDRTGHGIQARGNPDVSSYQQIVRTAARTDATTDIVKWWNGYRLRDVARSGIFAEMTTIWDRAEQKGLVDPKLRESFSHEGTPYAVPTYQAYYAMFYSRPAFEQLGLTAPETWDDFIAVAEELRDAGIVPIISGGIDTWEALVWFQQILNGLDPAFYTELTEGRASYLDATAVEAMEIWVDMYERGLFSSADADTNDLPGRFGEATAGMNLYGTWNGNSFVSAGLEDVFDLFLVPSVDPSTPLTVVTESGALAVAANAHKRDEALEVADAWLETEVQQAWLDFLGDLSANPAALSPIPVVQRIGAEVADRGAGIAIRYWEASPPVMVEGNVQELGAFMAHPSSETARTALQRMQKRADDEWKRWEL